MGRDYSRGPLFIRRIKHRKGHGVHSPFAYSLATEVLRRRECGDHARELCDKLLLNGLQKKYAVRIANLCEFCGFGAYAIDDAPENVNNSATILIATPSATLPNILTLAGSARKGDAVCVTMPRKGRERRALCERLAGRHEGMSIESRGMLLLFYDKGLNQQHIRV